MIRPSIPVVLLSLLLSASVAQAKTRRTSDAAKPRRTHTLFPVATEEKTATQTLQRSLFKNGVTRRGEAALRIEPQTKAPEPQTTRVEPTISRAEPRPSTPRAQVRQPQPRPEMVQRRTEVPAEAREELGAQPTSFTPYDGYLGPVRRVIGSLERRNATMVAACELIRQGRSFRYTQRDPYRADLPAVTDARRAGDCKSKALWLYDHLGDPSALFVIGKLERRSRTSHAWVYWWHDQQWWILDPTARTAPIAADSVSINRYVPYYSFGATGAYRHKATRLLVASNASGSASAPNVYAVRANVR